MIRAVVVLCLAIACDQGSQPATTKCAATADALIKNRARELDVATLADAKASVTKRCIEARWSSEARACLSAATSHEAIRRADGQVHAGRDGCRSGWIATALRRGHVVPPAAGP